jgi:ABC-type enterochelin transport system substrate-binding protein
MAEDSGKNTSLTPLINQIESADDPQNLIAQTQRQIEKDFSTFSVGIPFDKEETLDSLFEKLKAALEQLTEENRAKLSQILYRIDLSEPQLGAILTGAQGPDIHGQIAFQIIQREMKKVILRSRYSP